MNGAELMRYSVEHKLALWRHRLTLSQEMVEEFEKLLADLPPLEPSPAEPAPEGKK